MFHKSVSNLIEHWYKIAQYYSVNVKLSDSQLNKLKSATKSYWCNFQIRLSSSVFGTNKTNFPHKLLWTVRQLSNLSEASANNLSANIRLSKTQLFEIIQPGGFLGSWLTITFAKSVLIPLGLPAVAAAASAAYVGIHKKILNQEQERQYWYYQTKK